MPFVSAASTHLEEGPLPVALLEPDCAAPTGPAEGGTAEEEPSALASGGRLLLEVTVTSAAGLGAPE